MIDNSKSTIEQVPSEVFHKILNHLETSEILYSLYNVCRQMNALLISYNRYELDFRSFSRSDFNLFHSFIDPRNVISLILSDDESTPGQIGLFISLTNLKELQRLRSLTLLQIEERHLIIFLQRINYDNLRSLTIKCRSGPRCRSDITQILPLLSSTISQPNLRYLNLSLWYYEIKNLSWPTNCTLEHVEIDSCSFSELSSILRHSPHLNTLISNNSSTFDIKTSFFSSLFSYTSYRQLLSLSLNNIEYMRMDALKALLKLTPSLVYLKLIGFGQLSDGIFDAAKWEYFIKRYLLFLNKFEFFFTTKKTTRHNGDDLFSLIIPFSNNFWLENKKWFVTFDFIESSSQIRLYSRPICQPYFEYASQANKTSYSTFVDNTDRIDGIHTMNINLSTALIKQEIKSVFHQVTELELDMHDQWPINSFEFLSKIIDLSHLVKISLNIWFDKDSVIYTICQLKFLFERTPNVHTLHNRNRSLTPHRICSIVNHRIKYLQIRINHINDMKMILERLQHLISVTFYFPHHSKNYSTKIIKWLCQRGRSVPFWCNPFCIHLWIDNNTST